MFPQSSLPVHSNMATQDGNDKTLRNNDVWWLDDKKLCLEALFLITNFTNCHFWCSAILLPIHFNCIQKSSVNNLLNICYCDLQKMKASQIWVRKWTNCPFWMNYRWWFSSTTPASTCNTNMINICETEKNVM